MSGRLKILNLKNINDLYEEYSSNNEILKEQNYVIITTQG